MGGRAVVGIDIGGTKTLSAVVDNQGRVLARHRIETPQQGPEAFVAVLAQELGQLLLQAGLRREDVAGVGVGAPGPLDPRTGVVFEPPNLTGWRDVPLQDMLQRLTGLPAHVENDANAAALGEVWIGAGVGARDLIYMTVSTGIGGGLIFDGDLYHGVSGYAGEIGHMTVEPEGPICPCGRRGHLEAVAAGPAIARMAGEAVRTGRTTRLSAFPPEALTAAAVAEAAMAGDTVAREVYERAARYIGLALASLINVLNPELVIIGGGVSKVGDLLFGPVRRVVRERAYERTADVAKIVPAALGDDVGVIGAAAVVYRHLGGKVSG